LATRFAVLAADAVYLPAASFFESQICYEIVHELREMYPSGLIRIVGGGANLDDFIEDKLQQYQPHSQQFNRYKQLKKRLLPHPPFHSRTHSASRDISAEWSEVLESGAVPKIVAGSTLVLPSDFESRWEKVPERLDGQAFIVDYVEPLLLDQAGPSTLRNRLHAVINKPYFGSYTRELCAGVVSEMSYLAAPHPVPSYDRDLPYNDLFRQLRTDELFQKIQSAGGVELMQIRESVEWKAQMAAAVEKSTKRSEYAYAYMNINIIGELRAASIGVITALPEEFAAICQVLQCGGPIDLPGAGAGRKYAIARIRTTGGGEHVVAVGMLVDMGNDSAAIRATQMMQHCPSISHIIMSGIAGAVPNPDKAEHHVRLGDIVVSDWNGVIQYDFDKESPNEVEHRYRPRPPAASLIEAVRWLLAAELRGARPWNDYIRDGIQSLGSDWVRPGEDADRLKDWEDLEASEHPNDPQRTPGTPRVFQGPIASANKLLKNPILRNKLRDKFKVKAVEMEGAGIADATWTLERGYLVVRGTCDYCNPDKGDAWHNYAALAAAAYVRAVIEMTAVSSDQR
jgi:nucleoside phosphorylase